MTTVVVLFAVLSVRYHHRAGGVVSVVVLEERGRLERDSRRGNPRGDSVYHCDMGAGVAAARLYNH